MCIEERSRHELINESLAHPKPASELPKGNRRSELEHSTAFPNSNRHGLPTTIQPVEFAARAALLFLHHQKQKARLSAPTPPNPPTSHRLRHPQPQTSTLLPPNFHSTSPTQPALLQPLDRQVHLANRQATPRHPTRPSFTHVPFRFFTSFCDQFICKASTLFQVGEPSLQSALDRLQFF